MRQRQDENKVAAQKRRKARRLALYAAQEEKLADAARQARSERRQVTG